MARQNLKKGLRGKDKMPEQGKRTLEEAKTPERFTFSGRTAIWWLLSLAVLLVLLGVIYLLAHLSSADTEMYPTTQLRSSWTVLTLC